MIALRRGAVPRPFPTEAGPVKAGELLMSPESGPEVKAYHCACMPRTIWDMAHTRIQTSLSKNEFEPGLPVIVDMSKSFCLSQRKCCHLTRPDWQWRSSATTEKPLASAYLHVWPSSSRQSDLQRQARVSLTYLLHS